MRRLRPLSEDECYARCYGTSDASVRTFRFEPRRPRFAVLEDGEVLRRSFEERLATRDPDEPAEVEAEPEAA